MNDSGRRERLLNRTIPCLRRRQFGLTSASPSCSKVGVAFPQGYERFHRPNDRDNGSDLFFVESYEL